MVTVSLGVARWWWEVGLVADILSDTQRVVVNAGLLLCREGACFFLEQRVPVIQVTQW